MSRFRIVLVCCVLLNFNGCPSYGDKGTGVHPVVIHGTVVDIGTLQEISSPYYQVVLKRRSEAEHEGKVFEIWTTIAGDVLPGATKKYSVIVPFFAPTDLCRLEVVAEGYETEISSDFLLNFDTTKTFHFLMQKSKADSANPVDQSVDKFQDSHQ